MLSLLADTSKSGTLGLKIMGKSDILFIRLGTNTLFVRLGEEALPKILEEIIARLFIIVGLVTRGMPIIWGALTGLARAIRLLAVA